MQHEAASGKLHATERVHVLAGHAMTVAPYANRERPPNCPKAAKRELPVSMIGIQEVARLPSSGVDQSIWSTDLNGTAVARLLLGAGGVAALGALVGVLGLVHRLLGLAALLGLLQGGTGGGTDLRLLVALLADVLSRDTDDGTLDLGGLASATAGDLLNLLRRSKRQRTTTDLELLVHAAPTQGPHDLGGLLALHEERLALRVDEHVGRAIATDEARAVAGVDAALAERARLGS
ncbi:hypothetical protein ON010_g12672 [Phytophthora cinnamomi]|nr:hypothetical protein ON010_g12672 [Phytophthora cinnamomi]